jgi:hypothetical protein
MDLKRVRGQVIQVNSQKKVIEVSARQHVCACDWACSPINCAGGAGCGRPQGHHSRRKLNHAGLRLAANSIVTLTSNKWTSWQISRTRMTRKLVLPLTAAVPLVSLLACCCATGCLCTAAALLFPGRPTTDCSAPRRPPGSSSSLTAPQSPPRPTTCHTAAPCLACRPPDLKRGKPFSVGEGRPRRGRKTWRATLTEPLRRRVVGGDVEAGGGGGADGGDRRGTVELLIASIAGSCGFLVLSS